MHPLDQLDVSTRVAKRAQYEAFEFALAAGNVLVRNGSHPNPSEHEYLVTVEDGLPIECTCPADDHYEGACKHRVAVAIRTPLLDAVTAADDSQSVAADGGHVPPSAVDMSEAESGQDETEASDDDECPDCIGEFPCWECVRTGRKTLPD
ncbi:SWIM zinc finger family protein [Halosimplex pelagicum]|uniref:SWIM zinc finger family protein n=1 Tax=Halosimplex pelagicum TaxID=869886 RepID=A0A7D5PAI9_9EURY|nr:SWIM zinc finger family protein [Halosimplex pelagicum]QLH84817.1 SWIM zinc finger family protein [Halosimplex pelagicum]